MASGGWIKLYYKLQDWEWYQDSKMVHIFLHLLLKARREDGEWKGNQVKRGQVIVGLHSLKRDTGISIQSIRTCLKRFESGGEITRKSTNQFSIITLCNYDKYNTSEERTNKRVTNEQQTSNNKQEGKEGKEVKHSANGVDFESFWNAFRDKRGKTQAEAAFKKAIKVATVSDIISGAKKYAVHREKILSNGGTPKMAQGWLTDRRWEDEFETNRESEWE